MTVYEALAEMRDLSKKNIPFAFKYVSYSLTRGKSDGIVEVSQALLRNREHEQYNQYAELMEGYYDLNAFKDRKFWQVLLVEFNGNILTLK